MISDRPVGRAKMTLADLERLFLDEVSRANRGFVQSQLALAAELGDEAQSLALACSLGGRAADAEALRSALREQAKSACRLGITEVNVTFWAEPDPPGLLERILRFFKGRSATAGVPLFRLAPATRREHAAKFELRISSLPDGTLSAAGLEQPSPLLASAPARLLGAAALEQST